MSLEDPESVFVIFRRDANKTVFAIFPIMSPGRDDSLCVTARAAGDGIELGASQYSAAMRGSHAVKPKEYRELLHRVREVFGEKTCVIQTATSYMHELRAKRARGNV